MVSRRQIQKHKMSKAAANRFDRARNHFITKPLPSGCGMLPMKDVMVSSLSPHICTRETPQKPSDVSVSGPPWPTGGGCQQRAEVDGTGSRTAAAHSHSWWDTFGLSVPYINSFSILAAKITVPAVHLILWLMCSYYHNKVCIWVKVNLSPS